MEAELGLESVRAHGPMANDNSGASRTTAGEPSRAVEHVYVLEDDAAILEIVGRACDSEGVPAHLHNEVEPFFELKYYPAGSLILLDLTLGDTNGVEVLRKLAERRCSAAICLMTGVDLRVAHTIERLGKAYGLNMVGLLPKPFGFHQLVGTIRGGGPTGKEGRKRRQSFDEELHCAIWQDQLRLHYQPLTKLATGGVLGCEALVRWQHPQRGLLGPGEFLPLAEETQLVIPMTHWVLDEALRQVAVWQKAGINLGVSVNLPAAMLSDLRFPRVLERLLARHGVGGSTLTVEITEAEATRDQVSAMDVLARLRLMHVAISIDDFGTGHSSMIKLWQFPYSELKIDRSFVQDVHIDREAAMLTETAIGMAHRIGMRVVAEGVETEAVKDWLVARHCDIAQGYYASPPLPPDDFVAWIRRAKLETEAI